MVILRNTCCNTNKRVPSPTHNSTHYAKQAYQTYAAAQPQRALDIFSKF